MTFPFVRERGRLRPNTVSIGSSSRRRAPISLLLGAASILFIGAVSAEAATYYVTQSGSGSGNGSSQSNAWSVASFNSSTTPTGGDTVVFSGTITSAVRANQSGLSNDKRLTLDFSSATLTGGNPRISINGKKFLNINGGTMGPTTSETCISFGGGKSNDITIQNWKQTSSTSNTGGFISANYCYNLVVANNEIVNTRNLISGDTIFNHDITIANNYASSSLNTTVQTDIVFFGDAYNVVIEGNKFVHRTTGATSVRHNDIIQCYQKGGSNAGNPGGWVIRYNWLELDVQGGSGDTSWLMLQHMNNKNGADALKVYGNVFYGTPTDTGSNNGINVAYNVSGSVYRFYNNTVIRKNGPDNTIRFREPGVLYAQNNVGYSATGKGTNVVWTMTKGKFANNWFNNFGSVSSYTGTNGGTSDPQFTNVSGNDFSLKSSSPLIGKADSSIGTEYERGVVSNATWPNPKLAKRSSWDIGAFVSGSATAPGDTEAPVVSGLKASPAETTATITWTTNEPATSRVNYGTSATYGSQAGSSTLATSHSVNLTGLTAGTTYQYQVQATDAAGNVSSGTTGTFTTTSAPSQPGQLTAQPSSLDFGRVAVGASADQSITVKNTGGTSVSGSASVSAPFRIVSGSPFNIAAGQSQVVVVRYSPTAEGTHNGTVTLTGGTGATVPVTGSGYTGTSGGGSGGSVGTPVDASSGTLSGPFLTSGGTIYQSVQTTDVASAGRASFSVNIPEAGEYAVVLTLSAPSEASNSIFLNVDAEPQSPSMVWDIPVTNGSEVRAAGWRGNGTPEKNELTPKYFQLSAGKHEVIICGREPGVRIEKVSVVKRPSAPQIKSVQ